MILYIDTSDNRKITVKLGKEKIVRLVEVEGTQQLLRLIDQLVKKNNTSINRTGAGRRRMTEIRVNPGPGSFTGLRVGMSVANALGWVLKIPVNKKRIDQGEVAILDYK